MADQDLNKLLSKMENKKDKEAKLQEEEQRWEEERKRRKKLRSESMHVLRKEIPKANAGFPKRMKKIHTRDSKNGFLLTKKLVHTTD